MALLEHRTYKLDEKTIQNNIRKELSKQGVILRLNVGSFVTKEGRYINSGLPVGTSDLLFIGHKYIAFIEVKTPKGIASIEQLNFIEKMRSLGHRAGIARSVDDALKILKGESYMAFSIDYNQAEQGGLIPQGKYEVIIVKAQKGATINGTEYIDVDMVIRNDIQQKKQNSHIFHSIWKTHDPSASDLACEGYSSKNVNILSKAANLGDRKKFNTMEDWLRELPGKLIIVEIKHEQYNGKTREKVSYISPTENPNCKHTAKTKQTPVEDDYPFFN